MKIRQKVCSLSIGNKRTDGRGRTRTDGRTGSQHKAVLAS